MLYKRLRSFWMRSETRQNPLKAILKRVIWRIHWLSTNNPLTIPLGQNLRISIPKSGSGASIYYQGFSEPETADFIIRFLKPGMVMLDIGAHIGEYTLLAAQAVGDSGQVHTFEPQPQIFLVLKSNVEMNQFHNVTLNCSAVGKQVGELDFEIGDEPAMSSIRSDKTPNTRSSVIHVPVTSLDAYWLNNPTKIDLIKVDVEGAEKLIFQGATGLMGLTDRNSPVWIFEYAPSAYKNFGYQPRELLELLQRYGYEVWQYFGGDQLEAFDPVVHSAPEIINLIATKDRAYLLALLQDRSVSLAVAPCPI